jgi:ADP-ribose pyrophosphatase YjhB (NUDIX family)
MTNPTDGATEKVHSDYIHSIDVGVMRFNRNSNEIEILLIKRAKAPYADRWALPGIVKNGDKKDRSIDAALERLMQEKVRLVPKFIEQVETVGNDTRDPRCESACTFYMAFVDDTYLIEGDKMFVNIEDIVSDKFALPFDHNLLVRIIRQRLYHKARYSSIPLMMLPNQFGATEALDVFSAAYKPLNKSSMRQRLLTLVKADFIAETGQRVKPKPGKGPAQVEYKNTKPTKFHDFDRCFE